MMSEEKGRLKIIEVSLDAIKPCPENTKSHPKDQIEKIASSIREFGPRNPILLDDQNEILAGHGRYLAARSLGLETFPCIICEDLSEAQKRAYRIADNKLAESDWIEDLLKDELLRLDDLDFDLGLTGFTKEEIEDLQVFALEKDGEDLPGELPIEVPEKGRNILVRLSFNPAVWLGKREEILGVFDQMEKTYGVMIKVEE